MDVKISNPQDEIARLQKRFRDPTIAPFLRQLMEFSVRRTVTDAEWEILRPKMIEMISDPKSDLMRYFTRPAHVRAEETETIYVGKTDNSRDIVRHLNHEVMHVVLFRFDAQAGFAFDNIDKGYRISSPRLKRRETGREGLV